MGAPLFSGGMIRGAMYLDQGKEEPLFETSDLWLLEILAGMAAVKLAAVDYEQDASALRHIREDLDVAARIQMRLLPAVMPVIEGYAIAAHLTPCERVGGDLYDVQRLSDGKVCLTLGDVSGHGIGAALLMSHVMMGLRLLEAGEADPCRILAALEDRLWVSTDPEEYVTLFSGVLDPSTGRLRYANAGHYPPFVLGEGDCSRLPATGIPVALMPGIQDRELGECCLEPGAALLILSDGIPETRRGEEFYGDRRLCDLMRETGPQVRSQTAQEILQTVLTDVRAFCSGADPDDDLTLLVVKREV